MNEYAQFDTIRRTDHGRECFGRQGDIHCYRPGTQENGRGSNNNLYPGSDAGYGGYVRAEQRQPAAREINSRGRENLITPYRSSGKISRVDKPTAHRVQTGVERDDRFERWFNDTYRLISPFLLDALSEFDLKKFFKSGIGPDEFVAFVEETSHAY